MNEVEPEKIRAGHKSGFVSIVGRPNAGKSTLINHLVGQKVAIVTSKPQTTRNRIQGIVTREEAQIVLVDTPGIHDAKTALNRQMMREVAAAFEGIDVLLLMIDSTTTQPHIDSLLIEKAKRFEKQNDFGFEQNRKLPKKNCCRCWKLLAKRIRSWRWFRFSVEGRRLRRVVIGSAKAVARRSIVFSGGSGYRPTGTISSQRNCPREGDCADLPRSTPRAESGSGKVGSQAEVVADPDELDGGARFTEKDSDRRQRRHAEEDRERKRARNWKRFWE